MKIYSARQKAPKLSLRELKRQRDSIVKDFNQRKAVYDEQFGNFTTARETYENAVIDELKGILANELNALPGVVLKVAPVRDFGYYSPIKDKPYGIKISYTSDKGEVYYKKKGKGGTRGYSGSEKYGFNWTFSVFWYIDYWNNNEEIFVMKPVIDADIISADDYDVLAATYDLFTKLNTIDWKGLTQRIGNEIPKEEEFVSVENPGGSPSTYDIDEKIESMQLDEYVGEDAWIHADYYPTGNTKWPDRDRYIKITSEGSTKAYYMGYIGSTWQFRSCDSVEEINSNFRRIEKIRKAGIKPKKPIEVYTTEEMLQLAQEGSL